MVKMTFIQGRTVAIGMETTHCTGVSEWRREMGLNSEYNKDNWEFIAKEQDERQQMENN